MKSLIKELIKKQDGIEKENLKLRKLLDNTKVKAIIVILKRAEEKRIEFDISQITEILNKKGLKVSIEGVRRILLKMERLGWVKFCNKKNPNLKHFEKEKRTKHVWVKFNKTLPEIKRKCLALYEKKHMRNRKERELIGKKLEERKGRKTIEERDFLELLERLREIEKRIIELSKKA